MIRQYTNKLLEMIDDGLLDKDQVIQAFCSYMSESDVQDMMESNEMVDSEEEEEDEEEED
jgi:hypothetical protein